MAEQTGLSWRFVAVASGLVVLAFVAAAVGSDALGRGARRPILAEGDVAPVVVVESGPEFVRTLRDAGTRGKMVVHATARFGSETTGLGSAVSTSAGRGSIYPPPVLDAAEVLLAVMSSRDYMWAATRAGLVRRVEDLVPPAVFERRLKEAIKDGLKGAEPGATSLRVNVNGEVRHIYPALPKLESNVVLLVSASYFTEGNAQDLLSELRRSGVRPVFIVVSLDVGDPEVADPAREAARRLAAELEGGL